MKIKGKKVVNATRPLTLHITKNDVRRGQVRSPEACAAAVSAMRECPGALSAHVHLGRTYIEYDKSYVRYHTPPRLRTEIISFDRGHSFEEGEYVLGKIPPSKSTGMRQGGPSKTSRNRSMRVRRPYHFVQGVRAHAPKKSNWQ
jgi:hypothetical protein